MLPVKAITKTVMKSIGDNSPTILTALAVTGVITTTVLAVRATPKALIKVDDEIARRDADAINAHLTKRDWVYLTWTDYIPAAAMGLATIACIVGANTVNLKRQAALISAFSLTDTAFREYREKVTETFGEAKEKNVRDEVAKDRIAKNPVNDNEIIMTGSGVQLCYDALSGRYFESDVESIRKAENDINRVIMFDGNASLNEFYDRIGLPGNEIGKELGWREGDVMEIKFSSHKTPKDRTALTVEFYVKPVRDFWKHG